MVGFILVCVIILLSVYYGNVLFFFKHKTAYEMRISDWSSDVCSSDLHNRSIAATADALAEAPMPTLAVLNGLALGGGCELALACDMRIAAGSASIGLTEARIGAIPGAGGTQRLPRLIGTGRAFQMMYGGEPVDAGPALDWGLVNAVCEADRPAAQAHPSSRLVHTRTPP